MARSNFLKFFFSSKLHIPANIGTAAAPGEVPTGKFVSAKNAACGKT